MDTLGKGIGVWPTGKQYLSKRIYSSLLVQFIGFIRSTQSFGVAEISFLRIALASDIVTLRDQFLR
jgi:hypothetical protein